MSLKVKFTEEEWATLEYAPLWVLAGVGGADGKIDDKEVEAFTKELGDAPLYKDELVREIMMDDLTGLTRLMTAYKSDPRNVETGLSQVADALETKAPEHADNFKKVMLSIAAKVANASGPAFGNKVSENEKMAFAIIAASLRARLN